MQIATYIFYKIRNASFDASTDERVFGTASDRLATANTVTTIAEGFDLSSALQRDL